MKKIKSINTKSLSRNVLNKLFFFLNSWMAEIAQNMQK